AVEHPAHVRRIVVYGVALVGEELRRELADEEPPDYEETGAEVATWWKLFWEAAGPEHAATVAPRSLAEMLLPGSLRHYGHNAAGRAAHEQLIGALQAPMLALAGSNEMLRKETEEAAGRSPWITFEELGDTGIYAADEQPEEFARVVDDFLRLPDEALAPAA